MKFVVFLVLTSLTNTSLLAQHAEQVDATSSSPIISITPSNFQFPSGGNLYNNGPIITHVGTGAGGEDESVLQSMTLGLSTLGVGHQLSTGFRVADDFTVTDSSWDISAITFFAYQTGEIASTITAVNLQIWDGIPGDPGSNVVFGDTVTNIMVSTQFSNILRVDESSTGVATNRQIAASTVAVNINLLAGTYWLDWQSDGSGASGPWAPSISIVGQGETGDALQFDPGVMTWGPITDGATGDAQGMPFIIDGTGGPPPLPPVSVPAFNRYGLAVLLMLVGLMAFRRFKSH